MNTQELLESRIAYLETAMREMIDVNKHDGQSARHTMADIASEAIAGTYSDFAFLEYEADCRKEAAQSGLV